MIASEENMKMSVKLSEIEKLLDSERKISMLLSEELGILKPLLYEKFNTFEPISNEIKSKADVLEKYFLNSFLLSHTLDTNKLD